MCYLCYDDAGTGVARAECEGHREKINGVFKGIA